MTKTTKSYSNTKGIQTAKPPATGQTMYKDTTTKGLYLRVYANGKKVFIHRYYVKGKQRLVKVEGIELTTKNTPKEIGEALTGARAAVLANKQKLNEGTDPAIERDLKAREIDAMPTVEKFADTYIQLYAKATKKSWQQDKRYLDVEVVPALGGLALDKVERSHVIALLDKKQKAGVMVVRNRLISLLSKFFNFAIERGHIGSNPASGIKRTKEQSKERALSADEIVFIWNQTDENSSFSPSVRFMLRMILITGQRPGEVAQMHASQINGDAWTMQDTKNGRPHTIPLSEAALQVIEEARPHQRNGLLFPNTKGKVTGKSILPKAMSRLDWPELPATAHDLRRTAITEISKLGFNRLVQDRIANHVDNSIGGIYDRHDYMKEKRQALDAWSRKLSEITTGQHEANVVPFKFAS